MSKIVSFNGSEKNSMNNSFRKLWQKISEQSIYTKVGIVVAIILVIAIPAEQTVQHTLKESAAEPQPSISQPSQIVTSSQNGQFAKFNKELQTIQSDVNKLQENEKSVDQSLQNESQDTPSE